MMSDSDLTQPETAILGGSSSQWDVLIIGAGPAGATAAYQLASRGHRVLLLDRQAFPRDKTCGDCLITDALDCLREAGLEAAVRAAGHAVARLSIWSASGIEFTISGDYVTLRRRDLDALVARRAVEAGAVFARGEAVHIEPIPDGPLRCTLADGSILQAHTALVATGSDVRLLDHAGLAATPNVRGFAMRGIVRSTLGLEHLVVSFDRSVSPGYGWIFPLGGGLFNIGCGIICGEDKPHGHHHNLHQAFRQFLQNFAPARVLLGRGQLIEPLKGACLRCGLGGATPAKGPLLVAGDALGTTLPFTGEGIGKAMQTGRAAALAIHEALRAGDPERLSDYPNWLESDLRPLYNAYHVAQRWFMHPWVNDLIARRTRRSRYLQTAFAGVMDESVRPTAIFSLGGLLRSLWD